ncbi:hypothetical protein GCM10022423_31450 [Flavobacterium ginsengiterrae]|uniref:Uncharacterized protein n=1 Tax=Flavobacterium ginsengiterrae TaxID=871695 RepID=A0ABP7GS17_9FLAO
MDCSFLLVITKCKINEKISEKTNRIQNETTENEAAIKTKNNTSPIPIVFLKSSLLNFAYNKLVPKSIPINNKLIAKLVRATDSGRTFV